MARNHTFYQRDGQGAVPEARRYVNVKRLSVRSASEFVHFAESLHSQKECPDGAALVQLSSLDIPEGRSAEGLQAHPFVSGRLNPFILQVSGEGASSLHDSGRYEMRQDKLMVRFNGASHYGLEYVLEHPEETVQETIAKLAKANRGVVREKGSKMRKQIRELRSLNGDINSAAAAGVRAGLDRTFRNLWKVRMKG